MIRNNLHRYLDKCQYDYDMCCSRGMPPAGSLRVTTDPSWDRLRAKLRVFVDFTAAIANLSTCKRSQVGCVVVPPDLREVIAIGYNGPPAGVDNSSCRAEVGNCGCIHGEANALVKVKSRARDLVMFCTRTPCEHCAGLILNSQCVGYLVYAEPYRDDAGLKLVQSRDIIAVRRSLLFPSERV